MQDLPQTVEQPNAVALVATGGLRTEFFVQWFAGSAGQERGLAPIPVPDENCARVAVAHMPSAIRKAVAFRLDREGGEPTKTVLMTRDRAEEIAPSAPLQEPGSTRRDLTRRLREFVAVPVAALAFGGLALGIFSVPQALAPQPAHTERAVSARAAEPVFRDVRIVPLTSIAFSDNAPPPQPAPVPAEASPQPIQHPATSSPAVPARIAKPLPPRRPDTPARPRKASQLAQSTKPAPRPAGVTPPMAHSVFASAADVVGRTVDFGGDAVETALGGVRHAGGSIATLGRRVTRLID